MPELPPRAPTFPGFIDKLPEQVDTTATTTNKDISTTAPSPLVDMTNELPSIDPNHSSSTPIQPMSINQTSTEQTTTTTSTDAVPVVPLPVAPRRSRIRAILLWKDPKVTALYLSVFVLFFYLTLIRGLSVLSVIGALFGLYLILGLTATNANRYLGGRLDSYLARPPPGTPLFKRESLIRYLDFIIDEGNEVAEEIRDILYCDKTHIAFAWIAVAFVVYLLGKFCSLLSVLLVGVLAAFTVPLFYEKNKKQVDDTLAKASDAASRHFETGRKAAAERVVKLRDVAAEKSAPYLEKASPAARNFAKKFGVGPKES